MYRTVSTSRVCNPAPFTPLTSSLHLLYSFIHQFILSFIYYLIKFFISFNIFARFLIKSSKHLIDIFNKVSNCFKIEDYVKIYIFHLKKNINLVLNLKITLLTPSSNPDICPLTKVQPFLTFQGYHLDIRW